MSGVVPFERPSGTKQKKKICSLDDRKMIDELGGSRARRLRRGEPARKDTALREQTVTVLRRSFWKEF